MKDLIVLIQAFKSTQNVYLKIHSITVTRVIVIVGQTWVKNVFENGFKYFPY